MESCTVFANTARNDCTNCVGYTSSGLVSDNYTMVAVPFVHVNNDGKGVMLNSGDISITNPSKSDFVGAADQIWIWKPETGGYDIFYFYTDPSWGTGWALNDPEREDPFFEDCEEYANGLPEGSGIYFKAQEAEVGAPKAFVSNGAIEGADEKEVDVVSDNFAIIANPFPVAWMLNDADAVEYVNPTKNDFVGAADQMWIWKPETGGYDIFYFYTDPSWGTGWALNDPEREDPFFEDCPEYADGIPVGSSFYFKAQAFDQANQKSVVFKTPIVK